MFSLWSICVLLYPQPWGKMHTSWEDKYAVTSYARGLVHYGSQERCGDVDITVLLLVKKTMCLSMCVFMVDTLASRILHLIFVLTVSQQGCYWNFCWTHLHCLWLSCAWQIMELPWVHQLITHSSAPLLFTHHTITATTNTLPHSCKRHPGQRNTNIGCGLRCSHTSFAHNCSSPPSGLCSDDTLPVKLPMKNESQVGNLPLSSLLPLLPNSIFLQSTYHHLGCNFCLFIFCPYSSPTIIGA